jgi:Skp family chaperone for outer membrane proteins
VKNLLWVVSVLVVGALVYGGVSWVRADPKPPAREEEKAPRTRIALINLTYIIKNYEKFKQFQETMKGAVEPFQKRDMELKGKLEEVAKELKDDKLPEKERGALEKKQKELQKEHEDNGATAKKVLSEKDGEQMQILYKEIMDMAARYAIAHDFELVLHYNDATTPEDFDSIPNIARKLQAGALMPVYAAKGLDVSREVAGALNQQFSEKP